jgi:hypothetical protein
MYEFDNQVVDWCTKHSIRYSRYADDLTFSTNTPGVTSTVEPVLKDIVREINYPTLRLNDKKTTHLSKKSQRRITGLILTNEGHVSIGRSRKREISSLIHKFSIHQLPKREIPRLQGLLGFSADVEPAFLDKMNRKYGSEVISQILKFRKPDTV